MPPKLPEPSTRERILAYLEENRVGSVAVLSRAWGLTRADIRYHFNALLEEGLIEAVPRSTTQPARRGRPAVQYRLSASSTPDNLPALCSALLDAWLRPLPAEEREQALRILADRLAEPAALATLANSLLQRFNQAVSYLNQHGYRARWEAHSAGPRLLLRSCPYASILAEHPELCALDRALLERLVQTPFKQVARMDFSGGKPPACIFQ